jgi:hypothetical protein
MSFLRRFAAAWRGMSAADRTRVAMAAAFPFGALSHMGWVMIHGWLYYGPAPPWAVWFWYTVCVADFGIAWAMLARPRLGLALGVGLMAITLYVNWTQFPTFEYQFNWVLLGLTGFGILLAALTPWLWRKSSWRLADISPADGGARERRA